MAEHYTITREGVERGLESSRSATIFATRGRIGFDAPPRSYVEDIRPGLPGAVLRSTAVPSRDLALPVHFESAGGRTGLVELLRSWAGFLWGATLTMKVYTPSGVRAIDVIYVGGMEGNDSEGGPHWAPRVLEFHTVGSPYFHGPLVVSRRFQPSAAAFFPMAVGGHFQLALAPYVGVRTRDVAINPGDAPGFPSWTIKGPGGPVSLTNLRTGQVLRWTGTLSAADTLQIVTEPDKFAVRLNNTTSVFSYLDRANGADALWELPPGSSDLSIELTSPTAASYVELSYRPNYLSA